MAINTEAYLEIMNELNVRRVTLIAVSKTKPVEDINELYAMGQRDFGENYVQELVEKQAKLPADIRWHFIGHLQSNKVKYIAPFVHYIHGVDSWKLLHEINKQAQKNERVINCLLQVHIAKEETKFGLDEKELNELMKQFGEDPLQHVKICGLMGMASFSDDTELVRSEFRYLKSLFDGLSTPDSFGRRRPVTDAPKLWRRSAEGDSRLPTLSMGMSGDYKIAIEEGSNMVRIGSLIFGERKQLS
jgi:PLP dependent protein